MKTTLFFDRGITSDLVININSKDNEASILQHNREIVFEGLKQIGLNQKQFGLHSLRAGRATSADNNGVPGRLFKHHGCWCSENAKDGYVKDNLRSLLSVSLSLGI